MESRFGGSTLEFAEMSVQEPRRGSAGPGWRAASSPSKSKVRINPPRSMAQSLADSDSSEGESCASANVRNQAQRYEPLPDAHLFRPCGPSMPPDSFGDDDLMRYDIIIA